MPGHRRLISALGLLILILWTCLRWQDVKENDSTKYSADIVKVSIAINTLATSDAISRCLKSHTVHNLMHGYQHHVLSRALVTEPNDIMRRPKGVWSKPAYLLYILLSELVKPEEERVKWLFWCDADTLILNPHIRLQTFLPPTEDNLPTSQIHMILTENWDGINDGVFLLRVHPWSLDLLNAHLSFTTYHPDDYLPIREQSALSYLLHSVPKFMSNWTSVPSRWFNSFPVNGTYSVDIHRKPMTPELFDDGEEHIGDSPWKIVKGDMLVHFAGFFKNRDSWIPPWADRAEKYLKEWSSPKYQATLEVEVQQFWKDWIVLHQSNHVNAANGQRQLQEMSEQWLKNYEEKLVKISDLEKYEVRGRPLDE